MDSNPTSLVVTVASSYSVEGECGANDAINPGRERVQHSHRLPNELLVMIIRLILADSDVGWTYNEQESLEFHSPSALAAVCGVCRRWRECAVGNPSLWQKVAVNKQNEWFKLCIERSQSLPLAVAFEWPPDFLTCFPLLYRHRYRIRLLALCNTSEKLLRFLDKLLEFPLPALEELHVCAVKTYYPLSRRFFWSPGARLSNHPALHSITFEYAGLDWYSAGTQRLRCIRISDWCVDETGTGMSFVHFLRCLAECHRLEELSLDFAFPTTNIANQLEGGAVTPLPIVSLPRLKRLSLLCPSSHPEPDIYHFLSHLRLPLETVIHLYAVINTYDRDALDLESFLDHLPSDTTHLPILGAATYARISYGGLGLYIDGVDIGTARLGIHLEYPRDDDKMPEVSHERALREVCVLLARAPLRRVQLHTCEVPAASWVEFFKTFPAITEVAICCDSRRDTKQAITICEALQDLETILEDLRVVRIDETRWTPALGDSLTQALSLRIERGFTRLSELRLKMIGLDRNSGESMAAHDSTLAVLRSLVGGDVLYEDWN